MRISIRNQLAALVLLSSLVCLTIISVAIWETNHKKLSAARADRFAIIASLKASQFSSDLQLMERSVRALSSRGRLQASMQRYNQGNNTADNWSQTISDLESALAGPRTQLLTLQTIVYPSNATGLGSTNGLINVTGVNAEGAFSLPYQQNGAAVQLGAPGLGYPPDLYPNLTYTVQGGNSIASFRGEAFDASTTLLLGPLHLNSTSSLFSMTVAIINNTSYSDILGYMSVVMDSSVLFDTANSTVGLGKTGFTLIVGPNTVNNMLVNSSQGTQEQVKVGGTKVPKIELQYIFPPTGVASHNRHSAHAYGKPQTFQGSRYPLILKGLTYGSDNINDAGGTLQTHNEEGDKVALGYARPAANFCDWLVAVEYANSEAFGPINAIQNVLLACIFATAIGAVLWTFPIAHFASAPIRRLRDATTKAVAPSDTSSGDRALSTATTPDPRMNEKDGSNMGLKTDGTTTAVGEIYNGNGTSATAMATRKRKRDVFARNGNRDVERGRSRSKLVIPQKVKDGNHWIEDDLTDLTKTFNEMVDELSVQYEVLEDRVRMRTAELELSKQAAEAANESKTLFIANISHELKTPLNGILGMCAVALAEEDPAKMKRSINIIYKSGDLLHHLLTDLLTFSKHQAGKNLSLDEKEFRLRDVGTQLHSIFYTQAKDGQIDFTIEYQGPQDIAGHVQDFDDGTYGPGGSGKVKDMVLWGDVQRILQVAINLVSNALKFTPKGGLVKLRIRCVELLSGDPAAVNPQAHRMQRDGSQASVQLSRKDSTNSSTSDLAPDPSAPRLVFEFQVEDTGPGIPAHLQTQIFEPFVQGDLRLTKKYGGTGLGLSICSQLSKLMRGTLHLQSEVDKGSTFTLRIPLRLCRLRADSTATSMIDGNAGSHTSNRASSPPSVRVSRASSVERSNSPNKSIDPAKAVEQVSTDSKPRLVGLSQPYFTSGKPPMSSPGSNSETVTPEAMRDEGKVRVLVAEDNMTNAEVVTRMLKLEEVFDVSLAKDGQEALDKVKESMAKGLQFDLIFMDVQMPNLDGRESTRLIREMGYNAPIVALTAFSDEINQRECMESGMDYFLPKPIRRPALKQVLKTYCPPIQEEDESGGGGGGRRTSRSALSEQNPFAVGARRRESVLAQEMMNGEAAVSLGSQPVVQSNANGNAKDGPK